MTDSPALGFGEELRRERQIRGISLEEISSATKISVRLLTALEDSDVGRLPAPAFTRGFIRAYALHVGIDPDEWSGFAFGFGLDLSGSVRSLLLYQSADLCLHRRKQFFSTCRRRCRSVHQVLRNGIGFFSCNCPGWLASDGPEGEDQFFRLLHERFEDIPALLFGGREHGSDDHEVIGAVLGTESTGDFLP